MRKYLLSSAALVVLLGFGCTSKTEQKRVVAPVIVDVLVASNGEFTSTVELNGSVLSDEWVELRPEVSGRLIFLDIPDGGVVTKGTVLARINDADLQAQLEQQNVQLQLVQKNEQRLSKLLAVNGVNQADYDAVLSSLNAIQANIKVLNAQIDKTIIKAPFSGTLGLRQVSVGAYVTPQTLIGTLQQMERMKIDFSVPESYVDLVKVGDKVLVEATDKATKEEALISAIEPQINVDSRTLKVRARLTEGVLQPGAFVKVSLQKKEVGIMVPSNAIIPDANSNQVVLVKNGKAKFVNVETGLRNVNDIQLKSGISEGDSVVVSGVLFARPNANLKVRNVVHSTSKL